MTQDWHIRGNKIYFIRTDLSEYLKRYLELHDKWSSKTRHTSKHNVLPKENVIQKETSWEEAFWLIVLYLALKCLWVCMSELKLSFPLRQPLLTPHSDTLHTHTHTHTRTHTHTQILRDTFTTSCYSNLYASSPIPSHSHRGSVLKSLDAMHSLLMFGSVHMNRCKKSF